jgi:hypothetical protein
MRGCPGVKSNDDSIHAEFFALLEAARLASARSINALTTTTYWVITIHVWKSDYPFR